MDVLLRRYQWVVDLIGIMVGAALAGDATATLIAAALPMAAMPAPRDRATPPPSPPTADKSVERIVQRNIFCSTCTGAALPEPTRRALTLLAIMYAPPPAAALEAFTALRAASHVSLSIERDGRLMRMDYSIRDAI